MSKKSFLYELRSKLNGLNREEIDEAIGYYSEIIDDRITSGESEEDIIEALGDVSILANKIKEDLGYDSKLIENEIKKDNKRSLGVKEILILIGTFPLWFSALMLGGSLLLAFYIVLWSLVLVLYIAWFSAGIMGVFSILSAISLTFKGDMSPMLLILAQGFIGIGLSLVLTVAIKYPTKYAKKISVDILNKLKGALGGLIHA